MATSTGNKGNSRNQPTKRTTSNSGNRKSNTKNTNSNVKSKNDNKVRNEVILIIAFAVAILLFLCNFNIIGSFGHIIKQIMFGLFGYMAYLVPIGMFLGVAFAISNNGDFFAIKKLVAGIILFLCLGIVFELLQWNEYDKTGNLIVWLYKGSSSQFNGGGVISGIIAYFLHYYLALVGTILVLLVLTIISIVIITEKSFITSVKEGSKKVYDSARVDVDRRKERIARVREEEKDRIQETDGLEESEEDKRLRMDKKVSGVMLDTQIEKKESNLGGDNLHEITINDFEDTEEEFDSLHNQEIRRKSYGRDEIKDEDGAFEFHKIPEPKGEHIKPDEVVVEEIRKRPVAVLKQQPDPHEAFVADSIKLDKKASKKYLFPPFHLLKKGDTKGSGDSAKQLKETALRLQQTLSNFGVKVTITNISQGPSVTRYEMQPEQGVKVSKIVGLADDIKLNLAATDIRIEAPIPGKAAVGIEVPNKENSTVVLRDLLESKNFKEFDSNIAFAVGKDISGQTIVSDIAKMPHMLIAGATGSGKSVCINTLIMSILYKAHPDDVKLIMVDPKVVELSVYNGIPHLLIPVVTDPKKAAGALHWGVAEMTERYKKFADYNVRDLKGYNKKVETMILEQASDIPPKMPQIVIIVDELADLMMVAPGEVEESICRLAQLARAAGIHLIIATQRPSVDVITGLIKANMPSRVAFSVSSGVDSRTILDMNGAEKLLGKGDMLFYPQGYTKPARVQGAFVSDKEVFDVVDFLKNQAIGNVYNEDIQEKISNIGSGSSSGGGFDSASELDAYFADAGRFIIEKDKASIGMLQRVFKVGFNRAARIMDQLADAGVVGEEEGTKPRKVLMSSTEFENYLEETI